MKFFQRLSSSISLTFHFIKGVLQLTYGAWKLSKLTQPAVSIFGGSRLQGDSNYLKQAHELAHKLANADISVITGGGPGIMQAANYGAEHVRKDKMSSIGIAVKDLQGETLNPFLDEALVLDYFFARKYLLIYYSVAYVIFPGGYGTLNELSEILTLIETGKLKTGHIIFMGTDYWKKLFEWRDRAQEQGLLPTDGTITLTVTDDIDEAFTLLQACCNKNNKAPALQSK